MRRLFKTAFIAGIGAAIAYLFDPDRGRSRRAEMKQRLGAMSRDAGDEARRRARYEAGRMKGAIHEMTPEFEPPANDAELLQKVRSEAVGPSGFPTDDIEIHIEDGVVVLRGPTPAPGAERELIRRIADVNGVRDVRNELHV